MEKGKLHRWDYIETTGGKVILLQLKEISFSLCEGWSLLYKRPDLLYLLRYNFSGVHLRSCNQDLPSMRILLSLTTRHGSFNSTSFFNRQSCCFYNNIYRITYRMNWSLLQSLSWQHTHPVPACSCNINVDLYSFHILPHLLPSRPKPARRANIPLKNWYRQICVKYNSRLW